MASIKDAAEDALQDNKAFFKYIIFAIPLYLTWYLYGTEQTGFIFFCAVAFCFFMILGILTICSINVIGNKNQILPDFNLFIIFKEAFLTFLAIAPAILINTSLAYFITNAYTLPSDKFDIVLKIFIWFAFISIIFTTYLLFIKEKKISAAYNLKAISEYGADIMIALLFMIPLILLVNLIFLGPVIYLIRLFFGFPNPCFDYIVCVYAMFNIAVIGNYLAQISMEIIDVKEQKKKYESGESDFI